MLVQEEKGYDKKQFKIYQKPHEDPYECVEIIVVSATNAVIEPIAMMVEIQYTPVARAAVLCSLINIAVTYITP